MFQLLQLKGATCSQAADIGKRKITSIQTELGHKISPDTIANALAQGFKAILKIQLEPSELHHRRKRNSKQTLQRKIHNKRMESKRKNRLSLLFMPPYTLRSILKHDTHGFELGADCVGFFPILGFPCILTLLHQGIDVCG